MPQYKVVDKTIITEPDRDMGSVGRRKMPADWALFNTGSTELGKQLYISKGKMAVLWLHRQAFPW